MKKQSFVRNAFLLMAFLLPLSVSAADTQISTQGVSLTVNGNSLIRVDKGYNATVNVSLSLAGATEAGAEVSPFSTNANTRLKISTLAGDGETRKLQAQSTAVSLAGTRTSLSVKLTEGNTNFMNKTESGSFPTTADENFVVLSNSTAGNLPAQDIVTGIGTCWSGTGDYDGYVINYKYQSTGGGTPIGKSGIVITYTIVAG